MKKEEGRIKDEESGSELYFVPIARNSSTGASALLLVLDGGVG
jgi:hypothetical protein